MKPQRNLEVSTGLFVALGFAALIFLTTQLPNSGLRIGSEQLDAQGFPRTEIVLSGGLTKTPELGQIVADAFDTPVTILDGAAEGTAWGAALMAKYRSLAIAGRAPDWAAFLTGHASGTPTRFTPRLQSVATLSDPYGPPAMLLRAVAAAAGAHRWAKGHPGAGPKRHRQQAHQVEQQRQLLVGPFRAVVGLHRHQPPLGLQRRHQVVEKRRLRLGVSVEKHEHLAMAGLDAVMEGPGFAAPPRRQGRRLHKP